jgi:hypothetical protein
MQFAQSMAQRQMAFSRVLNFLILILLDFLVQPFFCHPRPSVSAGGDPYILYQSFNISNNGDKK